MYSRPLFVGVGTDSFGFRLLENDVMNDVMEATAAIFGYVRRVQHPQGYFSLT